jgi:Acyl-CoA carboxylase epsilon subunit
VTEPAQARPARNGGAGPGADAAPAVAFVAGNPSAEEVGVVVAVLAARMASAGRGAKAPVRSEWSARSRLLRAPLQRGPGSWRASALPR